MTSTTDGRPIFSRGAVISWGRSIGIPDTTALKFMRQEGVIITDDDKVQETSWGVNPSSELGGGC